MITVMPIRGEDEKLCREKNDLPDDVVIFHAVDGDREWYPTLRTNGESVEVLSLTGDPEMDELFIRGAASYGEYRFAETIIMLADCPERLIKLFGFKENEDGRLSLPVDKIIHYH